MLVHQDHRENWMEDNAIQQDGEETQRGSLISFDFGIKDFKKLFSPGLKVKMSLPQASSEGILGPMLPQSSEQNRGSNLGNKSNTRKSNVNFLIK